jgi:membrane-associated phospholipid phosphatase
MEPHRAGIPPYHPWDASFGSGHPAGLMHSRLLLASYNLGHRLLRPVESAAILPLAVFFGLHFDEQ